jgi:hypothetical protein
MALLEAKGSIRRILSSYWYVVVRVRNGWGVRVRNGWCLIERLLH